MKPMHKLAMHNLVIVAVGIFSAASAFSDQRVPQSQLDDRAAVSGQPTTSAGARLEKVAANLATAASDTAITTKVKAALLEARDLKSTGIKVETENGVVTLSGTVDTAQNIDRATQLAMAVEGVKSVNNLLSVKAQG